MNGDIPAGECAAGGIAVAQADGKCIRASAAVVAHADAEGDFGALLGALNVMSKMNCSRMARKKAHVGGCRLGSGLDQGA